MKIMVNGLYEKLERTMTVSEYLAFKAIDTKLVVVEWNFTMLPVEEWEKITLDDGDNLEIIRIIGGG